jgi:hypothetical protein
MEKQEYLIELAKLKTEHDKKVNDLRIKYGLSQAKFIVGDNIRDNSTEVTIKVEQISVGVDIMGIPYPRYRGPELKKDLTPKKNMNIGVIWGNNNAVKL